MLKYKVFADAAADVPKDLQKRYKIEVLPIPVTIDGQTYMSGVELENEAFYDMLEKCESLPVTSQITPYVFEELFENEFSQGTEAMLVFLINGKGSATYSNAVASRERFYTLHQEDGKKMKIHLFDGASYTGGYGYAAILAAQKLEMGMELDEVVALAQQQLKKQCIYFGLYTLRYAGKSGRIPSAAVFVGEALGIKPIMKVCDHSITTIGKARGEKKLVKEIVKMTADDMEPNTPYCVAYGSDATVCDELTQEMTKKIGYPPVYRFQICPAIALNSGPKAVGTIFEISSKKLEKENKGK